MAWVDPAGRPSPFSFGGSVILNRIVICQKKRQKKSSVTI